MRPSHQIILHSLVAKDAPLNVDIEIARELGFDGIEASISKICAFLNSGFSHDDLRLLTKDVFIPGIGFLQDIERQGEQKHQLFKQAQAAFELACSVGSKAVQLITGPIDYKAIAAPALYQGYRGLIDEPIAEQIRLTAANLRELGLMAADYGLQLYLEALAWTPLNTLERQLCLLEQARCDNLHLVVDFWHCYISGETPETIARLDKERIYGVHVCDSLAYQGGVPIEEVLRDIATGHGVLKLDEWVGAVKATGYEGWWSCELFCKHQQEVPYQTACELKKLMQQLLIG